METKIFDTLREIGDELSGCRTYAVCVALKLDELKARLALRELAIVPEGGWLGSNAEARRISADKGLQADFRARSLLKAVKRLERISRLTNAHIEGLEDRRRGLEYTAQAILKSAV